ncbi:MAG: FCD domain-containing protein [Alphaproteobacteria bacterium]
MEGGFQPIRKRRLSDEVTLQIRARVAAGELRPGDKLPAERDMADMFGVSRGAVREGLRALEHAGLVELLQGTKGGAFISDGGNSAIGEHFRDKYYLGGISLVELTEARLWLEALVVRVATERASEADFDALEANVDEAERLLKAKRYVDKIDVHIAFHILLAEATGNAVLMTLMSALMEVMHDFAHAAGGERHDLTIRARRKLLQAMRRRDADAAVDAMTKHLIELQHRYRDVVRKGIPNDATSAR